MRAISDSRTCSFKAPSVRSGTAIIPHWRALFCAPSLITTIWPDTGGNRRKRQAAYLRQSKVVQIWRMKTSTEPDILGSTLNKFGKGREAMAESVGFEPTIPV